MSLASVQRVLVAAVAVALTGLVHAGDFSGAGADSARPARYGPILSDQAGANSWPITGASFILVYRSLPDPVTTGEALTFFGWPYKNRTQTASDFDDVSLPAALIEECDHNQRCSVWK